jgi:hypothetical protein
MVCGHKALLWVLKAMAFFLRNIYLSTFRPLFGTLFLCWGCWSKGSTFGFFSSWEDLDWGCWWGESSQCINAIVVLLLLSIKQVIFEILFCCFIVVELAIESWFFFIDHKDFYFSQASIIARNLVLFWKGKQTSRQWIPTVNQVHDLATVIEPAVILYSYW